MRMETRDGNKRRIENPDNKGGRKRENKKTKYRGTKYRKRSEGAESQRQTDGRNLKENHEKTY